MLRVCILWGICQADACCGRGGSEGVMHVTLDTCLGLMFFPPHRGIYMSYFLLICKPLKICL